MKFKLSSNQSIGNAVVRDEQAESEDAAAVQFEFNGNNDCGFDDAIFIALENLSNSIRELAIATTAQKPPIVVNLIASNDEDLKKFATIFSQGIK